MRVKSNLKAILDQRGLSIRELSHRTGLPFESLRRLYNDQTKQYQRNTIGQVCKELNVSIDELLKLVADE